MGRANSVQSTNHRGDRHGALASTIFAITHTPVCVLCRTFDKDDGCATFKPPGRREEGRKGC